MQIFGAPLQNCHHERSEGSVLRSDRQEVPSGAKARRSIVSLMARLKPRPFKVNSRNGWSTASAVQESRRPFHVCHPERSEGPGIVPPAEAGSMSEKGC